MSQNVNVIEHPTKGKMSRWNQTINVFLTQLPYSIIYKKVRCFDGDLKQSIVIHVLSKTLKTTVLNFSL